MPETSQDAYETLFPSKQPITAQNLREGNKNQRQPNAVSLTAAAAAAAASSGKKCGGHEARISVGDLDSCHTIPDPVGYKRESSHRYAFFPF